MSTFAKKFVAFTGTGPAGRVHKFENSLAASDARLEQRTDALAEVAAAFVENADTAALREAERAVAEEKQTRADLVRGLETARKDLADEQKKAAEEAEAARQRELLADAERLDAELRDLFGQFIKKAEKSFGVVSQISGGKGTRFDVGFVMSEVAQEAAKGAENVLFVRLPLGFSLRLPALSPKLAALAAEAREIQVARQKNVTDFLAADSARAKEATASRPEFGYQKAAEIARRMP